MSYRVLVRKELDTDKWECSKAMYDKEKAMGVFFAFEDSRNFDVMLVQELRFSSARESMGVEPSDVEDGERALRGP